MFDPSERCAVTIHLDGAVFKPSALCGLALDVFHKKTVSVFLGVVDGRTELRVVGYRSPDYITRLDVLLDACTLGTASSLVVAGRPEYEVEIDPQHLAEVQQLFIRK